MKKILMIVSVLFISGCDQTNSSLFNLLIGGNSETSEQKALDENMELWESYAEMMCYNFVVQVDSFAPKTEAKRIFVEEGSVSYAEYIPSLNPIDNLASEKVIYDYFNMIQEAIDNQVDVLDVSYDPTYGFPTSIDITDNIDAQDSGTVYSLTNFTVEDGYGACTEEYAPVCAEVEIECISAPCEPVEETFSNHCLLDMEPDAYYLREGEC